MLMKTQTLHKKPRRARPSSIMVSRRRLNWFSNLRKATLLLLATTFIAPTMSLQHSLRAASQYFRSATPRATFLPHLFARKPRPISQSHGISGGLKGFGLVAFAFGASIGADYSPTSGFPLRMASSEAGCEGEGKVKLALCQIMVGGDKTANIQAAKEAISKAAAAGAKLISLPECWNSPYSTTSFPEYAETVPDIGRLPTQNDSPSIASLCELAKEHGIYLIGGSIPERASNGNIYNTCVIIDPSGQIIGKHRKMHLFDIDVPGKITFKESDTLTGGDSVTVVDTPYGKVGVGICYDIRFPELALLMRQRGAGILIYPGAFNTVTGPAHWELLQRARACDQQAFVATCSPARNPDSQYQAWGHSTVVGPWGEVLATTEHGPDVVYAELDLGRLGEVRASIPTSAQKRTDVYGLVDKRPPPA